jgi:hypothetical protein
MGFVSPSGVFGSRSVGERARRRKATASGERESSTSVHGYVHGANASGDPRLYAPVLQSSLTVIKNPDAIHRLRSARGSTHWRYQNERGGYAQRTTGWMGTQALLRSHLICLPERMLRTRRRDIRPRTERRTHDFRRLASSPTTSSSVVRRRSG